MISNRWDQRREGIRTISIPIMGTMPMVAARAESFHPPLLVNLRIVSCALPRGAVTQSGMMTMKTPRTWRMSTMASVIGIRTARKTLKRTQKRMIPIVRRVSCLTASVNMHVSVRVMGRYDLHHGWITYPGDPSVASPKMRVA